MLPVTPYRPGKYPPGPQWTQFGDDVLGHAMSNTSEEARQKLAAKREGMAQFHMDRLQRGGFAPVPRMQGAVHHTFADHNDPEEEYVDAYDRVERPAHLPRSGYETPSEMTASAPASPREMVPQEPQASIMEPLARVTRAGFQIAANNGRAVASSMGTALQNNIEEAHQLAKSGVTVVKQVGKAIGNASKRAASAGLSHAKETISSGASHAHQTLVSVIEPGSNTRTAIAGAAHTAASAAASAIEPGSNTRMAIAGAAHTAANAATTTVGAAKTVLEVAGPPIAHGAYASAHAVGTGLVNTAKGIHHVAGAAADVTSTHVLPAVRHGITRGAEMLGHRLSAAKLSAIDIINALDEIQKEGSYSKYTALENGHTPALKNTYGPRSRADSPKPRNQKRNTNPYPENTKGPPTSHGPAHDTEFITYKTADEWVKDSPGRAFLVDQLYKRPGWDNLVKHRTTGDLIKKLKKMSPHDLASIIVKLDSM